MKTLSIAKDLSLPIGIVTETIAILAKRRVGKSYAMRRIVEQLLQAEQQIVLVDPKGDQWGIRSSANGKKPGFPVLILGGEHGDLPLEASGGELVARLVVEERVNMLLDVSLFSKGDVARFMSDFLETLYRLKAQERYRTPMMLVVDEADAIAPQKPQPKEARMLGAIEDVVRRGGQRGIGCTLVTQRSAVLNKNVLTQAQMLVVLRTIAPQDIAAMKAWIDVHGSLEEGRRLIESLPALPIGDAWFWSPGWPTDDGIFKRVHVLPIETFDSGATPKPGQKRIVPKNLADVDLDALKGQMAATIEKKKMDDPRELRKQMAALTQELAEVRRQKGAYTPDSLKAEVERAVAVAEKRYKAQGAAEREKMNRELDRLGKIILQAKNLLVDAMDTRIRFEPTEPSRVRVEPPIDLSGLVRSVAFPIEYPSTGEDKPLTGGALRMLKVLVSRHPMKMSKTQLATFSRLSPRSGTYGTYLSALRSRGYMEEEGDLLVASQKALHEVDKDQTTPMTSEELIALWRGVLNGGARRMFDVLVESYPDEVSKEELGNRSGLAADSGTFGTYISTLRSNSLAIVKGQMVKASSDLFL